MEINLSAHRGTATEEPSGSNRQPLQPPKNDSVLMILSKTPTLIERRYRAKQSVVAAVCDRRWKNQISAVTDSRYKTSAVIDSRYK
jgi:hypothetical protein